ncbi:hypothetical protein SEA_GOCRAZY_91 [Arthrobacter phage GoCrazy]|uniref:Uncharacterized protein n=3 Tax=Mudcatvirus TaxID=1982088 RepID=A0AAE9BRY5_9CAUD|nr:hypothetical protein FDH65_gp95 [Arthrobacter phage Circum]YP_010666775.1 hypothetical protein PQB81_gp096 [Arthrobacter phage Kardesai]YP_010666874.1 hypothetical protein PQB82_gp95 [Arthrobacter phage Dynamite]QFP95068.1 hypothetical protein SEA_NAPOLEONB_96 [Arthrobacter phage NapoleonB]QXO13594.1 hypothetical protein SEA_GOCRAZY_91 [Arthrobacter phage GoCrazy]WBF79146.1 hypothetical protein SEA_HANKLY_98 [Arthrobacter phage Hankly]ALY08787.1 hypothetical protein CIRCUM_95 [Arthrobacter
MAKNDFKSGQPMTKFVYPKWGKKGLKWGVFGYTLLKIVAKWPKAH